MAFNQKKELAQLLTRSQKYATNISKMYSDAVDELLKLALKFETPEGQMFSFESNPKLAKQASDVLRRLQAATTAAIKKDIKLEWAKGNEAADRFLATTFGKKVLDDPRFAGWTKRNGDALDAFLKKHTGGMKLSDRVWKTAEQLREEMQLAMSVSMGAGRSSSTISREVRQYLREPDKLFRRVKVGTDADGNPIYGLSEAAKAYHPGQGVYRSSYKNAMRIARTETNAAYRSADSERWQQMDFVTGIRIKLSGSHPVPDICDTLQGDYPKDFKFTGWHPQCFCIATPIMVDSDKFIEMQQAILNGETVDVSDQMITDMPENFVKWCEDNKERIALAKKEDRLPYFLSDNPEKLSEALSASQLKDALKTEEYKLGKAALGEMKEIPDVDTAAMEKALKKGDLAAITAETEKFNQMKAELGALTYVDDGLAQAKQWGYHAIMGVEKSVTAKIDSWSSLTLEQQAAKLDFEANKYLGGNMIHKATGKPVQSLYPTWQVSQKAYLKELASVQDQIEWKNLNSEFSSLSTFNGGKGYDIVTLKASNAFAVGDKAAVQAALAEMQEYQHLFAETKSMANYIFTTQYDDIAKLADKFYTAVNNADISLAKGLLKDLKEWQTLETKWAEAAKMFEGSGSQLAKAKKAAFEGAIKSGNMAQAKAAIADAEKWKDIIPAYKEALAFKSKSAPYNQLVKEMGDAIDAGDISLAKAKEAEVAQKRAALDKKFGKKKSGGAQFADSYSLERKEKAVWDTAEKARKAGYQHGKVADDTLFDSASESWKAAIAEEKKANVLINRYKNGEISLDELKALAKQQNLPVYAYDDYGSVRFMTQREAMYEYTHHYCDVNEPLELRRYSSSQQADRFFAKASAMTDYLDTCATPVDMWFQRGDNDMSALLGRLNFNGQADDAITKLCSRSVSSLSTEDVQALVGKTMQEGGFMSTGSGKRKGFDESWDKRVIINIFAPKGSKAMYAEHFSQFGNGAKSASWDGSHLSSSFSEEFETIFQRGTKMTITKAEIGTYRGKQILYLDVEIVAQEARDLSYVPKSYIGW